MTKEHRDELSRELEALHSLLGPAGNSPRPSQQEESFAGSHEPREVLWKENVQADTSCSEQANTPDVSNLASIVVEHCVECWRHAYCTRHDEAKYNGVYYEVQQALMSAFEGMLIEKNDPDFLYNLHGSETPRCGAFEVYILKRNSQRRRKVFSKMNTHRWPNTESLVEAVRRAVMTMDTPDWGAPVHEKNSPLNTVPPPAPPPPPPPPALAASLRPRSAHPTSHAGSSSKPRPRIRPWSANAMTCVERNPPPKKPLVPRLARPQSARGEEAAHPNRPRPSSSSSQPASRAPPRPHVARQRSSPTRPSFGCSMSRHKALMPATNRSPPRVDYVRPGSAAPSSASSTSSFSFKTASSSRGIGTGSRPRPSSARPTSRSAANISGQPSAASSNLASMRDASPRVTKNCRALPSGNTRLGSGSSDSSRVPTARSSRPASASSSRFLRSDGTPVLRAGGGSMIGDVSSFQSLQDKQECARTERQEYRPAIRKDRGARTTSSAPPRAGPHSKGVSPYAQNLSAAATAAFGSSSAKRSSRVGTGANASTRAGSSSVVLQTNSKLVDGNATNNGMNGAVTELLASEKLQQLFDDDDYDDDGFECILEEETTPMSESSDGQLPSLENQESTPANLPRSPDPKTRSAKGVPVFPASTLSSHVQVEAASSIEEQSSTFQSVTPSRSSNNDRDRTVCEDPVNPCIDEQDLHSSYED